MPCRRSVPFIRVNLLGSPSHGLSPSCTVDIGDLLAQAKLWPNLLAEDLVLTDVDDVLRSDDERSRHTRSFPMECKPPLFILCSHDAQLPFSSRPETFELGVSCRDEDARLLLTAPTVPRMKLMIREHLYVQKWVNKLTSDNPPNHIPWSCEKPVTEKTWIAEGSVFPPPRIKSERLGANLWATNAKRADTVSQPCTSSCPIRISADPHVSTSHIVFRSAEGDPGILRGESHTPHRVVRTSQPPLPHSVCATSPKPDIPLAARRGKSLGGLKLKATVIEQLEYPDIPTAFRGSPSIWSTGFDALPAAFFTNHESMLLDLESKCAALGNRISTCVPEPLCSRLEMSLDVDEWMFAQELVAMSKALDSADNGIPKRVVDANTPNKSPAVPRPHSTLSPRSPVERSSDPPQIPLPPRPALVSPSTLPQVRGILKKAKSVRFEDAIPNGTVQVVSHTETPVNSPLPPHATPFSRRSCTSKLNTAKSSPSPAAAEEKRSPSRPRLPPKRTRTSGKSEATRPGVGDSPESTTLIERPCRIAHVKKNVNPDKVHQTLPKRKESSDVAETEVCRGIEGTTKSRLSTPLRNIFRLK